MSKLKVYGWIGRRQEAACLHYQTREIVAATSWKEAARLAGVPISHLRNFGSMTGNRVEVDIALASPGVIFWRPLDARDRHRYYAAGESRSLAGSNTTSEEDSAA